MLLKNRNMKNRIQILLVLSGSVLLGHILLLLSLGIGQKGLSTIEGILACTAGVSTVGLILLWYGAFFRPCRLQEKKDAEFAESETVLEEYQPEYYWSEGNRKVLERYQTVADRKRIMELSIQSSKVMAMQQQINPHFLYNTLEAIRSDMMIAGNITTADTVEALSHYFAYAASNADQITTIYEELENVRDYFRIQKFRFEDRIEMEIVDEIGTAEIRELCIPRLTLQPLVENAILHGLEKSRSVGKITIILTETGQELLLHVMDNGIGMTTEELNRLNDRFENPNRQEPAKKRGGIALDNVNSRIRLLFGEGYGLRAFSMKDVGTDMNVSLPRKAHSVLP